MNANDTSEAETQRSYAIGIDVGGTKIAAGVVDRQGRVVSRFTTHAHSEQQPALVLDAIEQAYHALLHQSQLEPSAIAAVGLGFPGNTDGRAGVVLVSSNLPAWNRFPLRATLAGRLGAPVVLDNDTNLGALGEHRYGAGRGTQNMCYVTFSTGYGMGIIINGQLYTGHTGTAGELGHVVIEVNGPPCTCGKRGCLMAYASGIGISRMVYERIRAGAQTRLRELAPAGGQRFPAEWVVEAARQGDEVAGEILQTAGFYCGVGLSMVVQILNPELIVIGGGLTRAGPLLLEPALAGLRAHTQPELLESARLAYWQLGDDLGVIGAAAQVFEQTARS
jgi:glucokinase